MCICCEKTLQMGMMTSQYHYILSVLVSIIFITLFTVFILFYFISLTTVVCINFA